jgi:uncharacterized protein (DUF58 family)
MGRTPGAAHVVGRGHGEDFLGLKLMRVGDDPRDIHWRKTAAVGQPVMRERARETQPDVLLNLDTVRPLDPPDDWSASFERRIREIASRAIAHLKRGDCVAIRTSSGALTRANRMLGADPLLRYLALVEPQGQNAVATAAPPS